MYEILPEAASDSLRTSPETPVLGREEGSAWVDVTPERRLGFIRWRWQGVPKVVSI